MSRVGGGTIILFTANISALGFNAQVSGAALIRFHFLPPLTRVCIIAFCFMEETSWLPAAVFLLRGDYAVKQHTTHFPPVCVLQTLHNIVAMKVMCRYMCRYMCTSTLILHSPIQSRAQTSSSHKGWGWDTK